MAEKTRCEICDRTFKDEEGLAMHNSAKHPSSLEQEKSPKKMRSIWAIAIIALLLIGGGFIFFNDKSINGNSVQDSEIQKITLSFKNNYYPNTINVKSGIPVEIELDNSVRGCFRSFNIPKLGVSKRSSSPEDTIKFTPNQKGTFKFQCGMGMGTGTIIVE
ncbi:cupredoxin domain-containing protein [Candidatus Pacearchaeota archaeon]|nr:cupredoxin domain-containing protein [Candidatus Pacearchaeota archaeon]